MRCLCFLLSFPTLYSCTSHEILFLKSNAKGNSLWNLFPTFSALLFVRSETEAKLYHSDSHCPSQLLADFMYIIGISSAKGSSAKLNAVKFNIHLTPWYYVTATQWTESYNSARTLIWFFLRNTANTKYLMNTRMQRQSTVLSLGKIKKDCAWPHFFRACQLTVITGHTVSNKFNSWTKAAYVSANFPLQTMSILGVPRMTSRRRLWKISRFYTVSEHRATKEFQGRNDMK